MPDPTTHQRHHEVIAERAAELHGLPSGRAAERRRRAAGQRVWVTLAGHLRSHHGRKPVGPPVSIDELHRLHVEAHRSD